MNELEQELFDYIKERKYRCCFCHDLKKVVLEKGLQEIDNYNGMICGSVEDMMIRYSNVKSGKKHNTEFKSIDPMDILAD